MNTADLVIRGGTVVDGTGAAPREADVVIEGDRVTAIGAYDGPAREVIDAKGLLVTPGFVDIHTHLDAQITWDPIGVPSCLHGVTSVVVGNCGVGFAPCKPGDREYLMYLMEGVEDVPAAAMRAGLRWDWETFPEYLGALARQPLGLNVGAHISHAPLRIWAMGERGATDAEPNDVELAAMREAVAEALRAGALGFATGRTTMHRTPAWDPVPGTFASRRELTALGGALAEEGHGVFELVPYGGAGEDARGVPQEFEWMTPLARDINRPISLALIQNLAYPDGWREALELVGQAAQQGARIVPQTAVRAVGILIGFGIAINPLALYPAAGDLIGLDRAAAVARLRDPAVRAQLLDSVREHSGEILGGMARLEHVFPLSEDGVRGYETTPDRSLVSRARVKGVAPLELMLDLIIAHEGRNFFLVPLFNPDLEAAGAMLAHPLTTIGLGDAGAHTTQTSDASYSTFALAYWVRERRLMPLERMVHKLTAQLAEMWGIADRGVLRPGAFADVNAIDFDRLDLRLPEVRHDMPTGAAALVQDATGYVATVVNGRVLMRDGKHTGAFPGVVLRG
ncbi:MAG TPA: amidohydrolase family protein [Candidatus Dormibacteraeota bacterium]|nr:amidohydrolase family protein [Candidatus Dormibacteraeota bacterium]